MFALRFVPRVSALCAVAALGGDGLDIETAHYSAGVNDLHCTRPRSPEYRVMWQLIIELYNNLGLYIKVG